MKTYRDRRGNEYYLVGLELAEKSLVAELVAEAEKKPNWNSYSNYWMKRVGDFYRERGLSRSEIIQTPGWKIGQDLCGRLSIEQGHSRAGDYRDELQRVAVERFRTRREFCLATGLSEDMLSHVLAKRKHLAIDTLSNALDRIGYELHIVPKS